MANASKDLTSAERSLGLWRAADRALLALYRAESKSGIVHEPDRTYFQQIAEFLSSALAGSKQLQGNVSLRPSSEPPYAVFGALQAILNALSDIKAEDLPTRIISLQRSANDLAVGNSVQSTATEDLRSFLSKIGGAEFQATARRFDNWGGFSGGGRR